MYAATELDSIGPVRIWIESDGCVADEIMSEMESCTHAGVVYSFTRSLLLAHHVRSMSLHPEASI
jgi:hypothetical protein